MEKRLVNLSQEVPKEVTDKKRHLLSINLFGTILTSYRIRIGLSQVRLGRRSRVSVGSIQRIERGDGWVLIPTARRLARALNNPLDSLMQAPHDITSANNPRLARSITHDISETMRVEKDRREGRIDDIPKPTAAHESDGSELILTNAVVARELTKLLESV